MERTCDPTRIRPRAIIVMGVSGSGKSTLGALLAQQLGCPFLEGDSYHDAAAVAKMSAGQPLTDDDRWPWLDRLAAAADREIRVGGLAVVACSALKRSYRERLSRSITAPTAFVLLDTSRAELARRMRSRAGHYMPESLLDSQLATLERPMPGEQATTLDSSMTPDALCRSACAWLEGAVQVTGG